MCRMDAVRSAMVFTVPLGWPGGGEVAKTADGARAKARREMMRGANWDWSERRMSRGMKLCSTADAPKDRSGSLRARRRGSDRIRRNGANHSCGGEPAQAMRRRIVLFAEAGPGPSLSTDEGGGSTRTGFPPTPNHGRRNDLYLKELSVSNFARRIR